MIPFADQRMILLPSGRGLPSTRSRTTRGNFAMSLQRFCFNSSRLSEEGNGWNRDLTTGIESDPSTASTCAKAGGEMRRGKMPNREFTPSSGNVFADLNLPRADDLLAKAELAAKIIAEIQCRRLTQSQAAAILGIDQPKVSALKQGKLSGFSIERLMRLLLVLGRDIEITVKGRARSGSAARLRVA
jgi:predicted XRE-type DNA-binding protein